MLTFREEQIPRFARNDPFGCFFNKLLGQERVSDRDAFEVHLAIAIGMLMGFLMLSIESYLAPYTMGKFQISFWRFGPTEIRLLLASGNLALLHNPHVRLFGKQFLIFDIGGAIAIVGTAFMLVDSSIRHTALVGPFVTSIPRESLELTLTLTRTRDVLANHSDH